MRCEEIEPLIYLWKPGELNVSEQQAVDEHLSGCSHCKALQKELLGQNLQITSWNVKNKENHKADFYIERIFEKVRAIEDNQTISLPGRIKQFSIYCFRHPVYRYMSAAIISALVVTFLLQNYIVYRHISALETKFGNPSSYAAIIENKPILLAKEDFSFIKSNSMKPGIKKAELNWFKSSQFLLMTMRKHKLIQEIASHKSGIEPFDIIRIYNNSVFTGESKRNQYNLEEKL